METANQWVTLNQHILAKQGTHPEATGKLTALLNAIGLASKQIAAKVRRAGLIEVWGSTGDTNVQGERVQKLDEISQSILVDALKWSGTVALMASEEEEAVIPVDPKLAGDYVVCFDPLDGSSNIDANVSIGTIFAVYRRRPGAELGDADVIRPGREQIASGYVIYGSSTVLVYTDGTSVDAFTLDPGVGEFFLTRKNIQMPSRATVLSTNECNEPYWPSWVAPYLAAIKKQNDHEKRRVTGRHIGSLVADFHRNLVYGGVFLYPSDVRTGRGKLRVLYECNPLAFIAETAGGAASTGDRRILDVEPTGLHDRCALIIGPKADVELAERCVRESVGN